jgi:regulatory protein
MTKPYTGTVDNNAVLQYAFYLLSRQDYTEKALKKKLSERFPDNPEFYDDCIDKCKSYEYINDERFALRYAKKLAESGNGVLKIKQKMYNKKFPASVIDEAISSEEVKAADPLIHALYWKNKWCEEDALSDPKVKNRILARLVRKGFPYPVAKSAIEHKEEDD